MLWDTLFIAIIPCFLIIYTTKFVISLVWYFVKYFLYKLCNKLGPFAEIRWSVSIPDILQFSFHQYTRMYITSYLTCKFHYKIIIILNYIRLCGISFLALSNPYSFKVLSILRGEQQNWGMFKLFLPQLIGKLNQLWNFSLQLEICSGMPIVGIFCFYEWS